MTGTATKIDDLETFIGSGYQESLYKLSPPLDGFAHVVIGSGFAETVIWQSNAAGLVSAWKDDVLSVHRGTDHAAALRAAGYEIVDAD